jgi:transposase InsO family protein
VARIVELAREYGRYGYRRITALLRREGWRVNAKRVERIWRREGLKVPRKQPKRGRLWFADGSCIRRRAEHRDHVWTYDFVFERTHDGRPLRMLTLVDEYTRECLAIDVERRLDSENVLERLEALFVSRGTPEFIRSDNGAEFTAKAVRAWLARVNVKTLYIAPGSFWENGYIESFNGKLRDELLDREIFYTLAAGVQHVQATQRIGLPASGTRSSALADSDHDRASVRSHGRSNIGRGLNPGAGHLCLECSPVPNHAYAAQAA